MTRQVDVLAALRRQHLFPFLVKVFETLHPGEPPLDPAWYLRAMCHGLEGVGKGERNRYLISVPPRHLKSITTAVAFVAWMLGHRPSMKIMVATYSQDLARKHADGCRTIMESAWYRQLFPATRIKDGGNRQLETVTTAGGVRKSVSLGGSVTGHGADLIIVDDLMMADEAFSPTARENVRRWFDNTLVSRLNDKRSGAIISIQQRLHEDDLPAYLMEKGYDRLILPAIAEKDEKIAVGGGRYYHRRVGDLLNPERENDEDLARIRREMGPQAFSAQYQQNPVLPEGNLVRIEWFGRVDELPEREECQMIVQSWDTGMSDNPNSDPSVCLTWGWYQERWHLLDVLRERLGYPDLRRAVLRQHRRWRADHVVIEDAGSGISLYQDFLSERRSRGRDALWPVMSKPWTSKEERLSGQTGQLEAGLCVLPHEAPWLDAFLAELRAFPRGRHDDQVDALSQFLEFVMNKRSWLHELRDPLTGRKIRINRPDRINRR
nr:phage terminase large subunit [Sphingomonas sp. CDS-1]